MLYRQAKAQLRRRSQQVQEELELDLRILEDLAVREAAGQKVLTARKEKARADAEWMRQVSSLSSLSMQCSDSCMFLVFCRAIVVFSTVTTGALMYDRVSMPLDILSLSNSLFFSPSVCVGCG